MSSDIKKLNVVLFGSGKMGLEHIRAIKLQKKTLLVGVADPLADHEKLKEILPEGAVIYSSAEGLLKDKKPDIVHVCTPPATHADLSELAIKYGAHVYVEKPFALSLEQAKRVLDLASKNESKVCAGHQLLYSEAGIKARDVAKNVGRVVHVESYFSFKTVRRTQTGNAPISAVEQMIDILPHPVYLLIHFLQMNLPPQSCEKLEITSISAKSDGNVHMIIRYGDRTGVMVLTLEGRPVESYVRVVGTNGSITADYVREIVLKHLGPGVSGISKVIHPYSSAFQNAIYTAVALIKRFTRKNKSYSGLAELTSAFYESIRSGNTEPLSPSSIIDTVEICEKIGIILRQDEKTENDIAEKLLKDWESKNGLPDLEKGRVLITGGTGLLGNAVALELRDRKRPVRVLARRIPPAKNRLPGVEYVSADLGGSIKEELLDGVTAVVHCAAETAGGKEAHEKNSILATKNILNAVSNAGIKKFIHISSIAVLKTSEEMGVPISENTPLDSDNEDRGPYVWGKVESERIASEICEKDGIQLSIIRPGPLVDYNSFEAPGRLGREAGPLYVAVGSKRSKLSLCDVQNAAKVINLYVENDNNVPPVLNLIEPDAPTRGELVAKLRKNRPDLRVIWLPFAVIKLMSPLLVLLQRVLLPGRKPVDISAAFASEKYNTDLVVEVFQKV